MLSVSQQSGDPTVTPGSAPARLQGASPTRDATQTPPTEHSCTDTMLFKACTFIFFLAAALLGLGAVLV